MGHVQDGNLCTFQRFMAVLVPLVVITERVGRYLIIMLQFRCKIEAKRPIPHKRASDVIYRGLSGNFFMFVPEPVIRILSAWNSFAFRHWRANFDVRDMLGIFTAEPVSSLNGQKRACE